MTEKTEVTTADHLEQEGESPFAMFDTDREAEKAGIDLDYGAFYFTIARAGGANKKFTRHVSEATKPYKRLIQEERMPETLSQEIAMDAIASTVVLGWGSKKHGAGNMIGKDGEKIPYSKDAVVALFTALPELFQDVYEQARKVSVFRVNEQDEDSKNS